jgi:hypothetical protein
MLKAAFSMKKTFYTSKLELFKEETSEVLQLERSVALRVGHFGMQIRNILKVLKRRAAEGWRRSIGQIV